MTIPSEGRPDLTRAFLKFTRGAHFQGGAERWICIVCTYITTLDGNRYIGEMDSN